MRRRRSLRCCSPHQGAFTPSLLKLTAERHSTAMSRPSSSPALCSAARSPPTERFARCAFPDGRFHLMKQYEGGIAGQNVAGATQDARRIRLAITGALWRRANVRNSAARLSKLGHAAREIAQMQAQLIERKAECKDALHGLLRQRSREAFAA
jgi:hypothetical protein